MDTIANSWVQAGSFRADDEASAAYGFALVMDELAHGVIVTTTDAHILHANQAARHELARQQVISRVLDKLQADSPGNAHALQDALSRVADGKRSLIELAAPDGGTLSVAAVPLRSGTGKPPIAALFFARSMVCDSLMLTFYSRTHGLTATEEQVLGVLCQGYSAPQVALQMKVAVSTVRSHVRSLCAKTRSSSVRELVSRVAVLPPVAPPFPHAPLH